jgi:hypothetical protein
MWYDLKCKFRYILVVQPLRIYTEHAHQVSKGQGRGAVGRCCCRRPNLFDMQKASPIAPSLEGQWKDERCRWCSWNTAHSWGLHIAILQNRRYTSNGIPGAFASNAARPKDLKLCCSSVPCRFHIPQIIYELVHFASYRVSSMSFVNPSTQLNLTMYLSKYIRK